MELLPRTALQPDTRHRFLIDPDAAVTEVRLDIYPDGGLARLRARAGARLGVTDYPRDMVGYGRNPPHPQWPGDARIAVQFVLNYEEGAENNVLDGDRGSETFLSEITPAEPFPNRHMSMESMYEYGSRAGLWRVLRVFERRGLPLTIFAVARAMQRNPEAVAAFTELGHEIACHGLRWKSYQLVDPDTERDAHGRGRARSCAS